MINMVQQAKDQAADLAMKAYRAAAADGTLLEAEVKTAPVEIPKEIGRASCRERVCEYG